MIQKVSQNLSVLNFAGKEKKSHVSPKMSEASKKYADCFIKHASESAPMLLGFTALWSALDYGKRNVPIQKSILNNLAFFFLPVLVASSAVSAGIETKKTSKSTNS